MESNGHRRDLPARRSQITFEFEHPPGRPIKYRASVGLYADETPGELFLNSATKAASENDTYACDAAIAVSLAMQFGCPIETLRKAMKRNADGSPQGVIGRALDEMAKLVEPAAADPDFREVEA